MGGWGCPKKSLSIDSRSRSTDHLIGFAPRARDARDAGDAGDARDVRDSFCRHSPWLPTRASTDDLRMPGMLGMLRMLEIHLPIRVRGYELELQSDETRFARDAGDAWDARDSSSPHSPWLPTRASAKGARMLGMLGIH